MLRVDDMIASIAKLLFPNVWMNPMCEPHAVDPAVGNLELFAEPLRWGGVNHKWIYYWHF